VYPNASRRSFCRSFLALISVAAGTLDAAGQESGDAKKADGKKSDSGASDDHVYEPGGDVKPPKVIHYVEPSFSPKSKEAYVEGTVKISTVVTTEGSPKDLRVISGLNAEEDQTAVDALKQWKFQPGTKNGQAVNVRVTVEVSFHSL